VRGGRDAKKVDSEGRKRGLDRDSVIEPDMSRSIITWGGRWKAFNEEEESMEG